MLVTEYLPEHGVYIATPVMSDKTLGQEFIFTTEIEQEMFVEAWFHNPVATIFAYNVRREYDWFEEMLNVIP